MDAGTTCPLHPLRKRSKPSSLCLVAASTLIAGTMLGACSSDNGPPGPSGPAVALGWVELAGSPPPAVGGTRHEDIFFVDPTIGWLVNLDGRIYRTADAGAEAGTELQLVGRRQT